MRSSVPNEFTIGESLAWQISLADYPAGDWTLVYYFRGTGKGFDATATADGTTHLVSVPASATAECSAGRYAYQAFVSRGAEKIRIDAGEIDALASFADMDVEETIDTRTENRKILDAIDARLKGDVTKGVLEYTIGDRQLKRYTLAELRELRKYYAGLVAQEIRAERMKKGGGLLKTHRIRFGRSR